MKELILGGVRSGKSRYAEQRATDSGLEVVYVATATAGDDEMRARIATHRQRRAASWKLIEEPRALIHTLHEYATPDRCLLVECLTLWLTNLLGAVPPTDMGAERQELVKLLPELPGHIILVSNEVGMGVVPLGELSRRYCDEAGLLHQELAQICDRVIVTVAGLPQVLKGEVI